ncbi:CPBP family intramembrane metalloprotease [Rhodanobacter sp. 7MK24]|uniref:CPBP family intramembrane glutamic endopeptidase n=1 Tax=Rhodanobacter sp. 7MK24 TaxID=2775922 RepID=UPI00177BF4F9|nr:CPBP family intramembrane glutamic endopeptidase [Rhodanobacter sp. 7MK24]MBD8881706.1 CPBP family intramembrane metalloprotease [Rhodanobacter sp. 7MK24]
MKMSVGVSSKRSLRLFFLLAFVIAWGFWLVPLLGSRGVLTVSGGAQMAFLIAGSYAPFLAVFIALLRDGGWSALGRFASRALRWRIALRYLLAALLLIPALGLVAAWVYASLGGPAFALAVPAGQIPLLFAMMLFMGGAVNEEFGWAYAIDNLQRGRRLLPAAVMLGVIWACWHLPLFFIVGVTQSFLPFWAFAIFAVALRVLFVWAYESTGKSILATLLFHTTLNLTLNLFVLVDRSPQRNERGFIVFALLALGAAAAVALASRCYRSTAALPAASAEEG